MGDIYYSTDEEIYNHDCIHDALDQFEIGETVTIYQGESVKKSASDFCHFDSDGLAENALDSMGDFADGWLTTDREQELDLQEMVRSAVDKWADKHGLQPSFYGVKNQKTLRIKITADDEHEIISDKWRI